MYDPGRTSNQEDYDQGYSDAIDTAIAIVVKYVAAGPDYILNELYEEQNA